MALVSISKWNNNRFAKMNIPLITRIISSNTIFQYFRPIPDMQLAKKEELAGFPNDTWKCHEAYPAPGNDKSQGLKKGQAEGIDTVCGGEDTGDEF